MFELGWKLGGKKGDMIVRRGGTFHGECRDADGKVQKIVADVPIKVWR